MKSRAFILVVLSFICRSAVAQEPWTLQQCIDRALNYNIEIKQSSLNNDVNKDQVTQNIAAMFPSINGNASQDYFFGRSIDPYTNLYTNQQIRSNSFSLVGSMTIFEGFRVQNALKESKLNYLSSQNDLKKIQNDISLNVVNYYLAVLYNDELLKNALEQMNTTGIQRDRMKRMYEVGSVSKGNYLDLESQYASDEVKYIEAQSQYDQSLLLLTQLLELDTIKNFSIVKPEVIVPVLDSTQTKVDRVFQAALKTQPEIKSSEFKVLSAEKGLSVSKGSLYPRLTLSGALSTNYSTSSKDITYTDLPPTTVASGFTSGGDTVFTIVPHVSPVISDVTFKDQFNNNLGKSVGLSLQVPIFNGWSARNNIARSRANLEHTKLNDELTRKTLYKSVQQAVADAISSGKKMIAGQRSVDALEETFNYNQQRLDLGLISTYDYLISKNNLANSKATLLQAKYDFIFRIKILDFYEGKPLTF